MPQLLTIDEQNIIGGPAMLMMAPSTYPLPSRITEILSLSSYAGNSSYGFIAVGATAVGVTFTREVSTKEWRSDQQGLMRVQPLDYKSTLTTQAMETTQVNKERLQQASAAAANLNGENVTVFEAAPFLTVWRAAIVHQSSDGKFHARLYPHAQWDGKAQKEMFERGSPDTIDFSLAAYPSSDLVGPNGFNSDRVDFDQP